MTVTSFYFLVFLLAGVLIFYIVPKKVQWVILLLMSVIYYLSAATPYTILFVVGSVVITYVSTCLVEVQRKKGYRSKSLSVIAIIAILINVIIWFLLKGSSFWISGSSMLNRIIPSFPVFSTLPFVAALGMGYYTAQIIGYILDVYWENIEVQHNPFKLYLFVSFFPQLTVGPISRYEDLRTLYEKHSFQYRNICFGSQRILWGLFKKLVISDRVGIIVSGIWADTDIYLGLWPWIATLLYPVQIYTDFSGCMDIVLGAAELFDIHLAENFRNPFFSRNCQEFWQRWHITLGGWARDYVFYPLLKSKWMIGLGKKCRKRFGKHWGKFIPWSVAMAVLWFVMGFWHGSVQHIFGVSLWFWAILFISELFLPITKRVTKTLEIKTESFGWHLFQSSRTYLVYAVGAVFFSASDLREALAHFELLLTAHKNINPWILFDGSIIDLGVSWGDINILMIGVMLLFTVAALRENYGYARNWMSEQSFGLRWFIWIFLFVMVLVYGMYGPGYDASTFIYQGF